MMSSNDKNKKIRRMVLLSNLIAAAIILGIIESRLQIIPVPGAKLGLANLITIVVLYLYSYKEALLTTFLRVTLVAILSGTFGPTLFMGLTGGIISVSVMAILKNFKIGIILVSLLGSVSHQIGQIIAGILMIGAKEIVYYLYIMLPLGILAGIIIGLIAEKFILSIKTKDKA